MASGDSTTDPTCGSTDTPSPASAPMATSGASPAAEASSASDSDWPSATTPGSSVIPGASRAAANSTIARKIACSCSWSSPVRLVGVTRSTSSTDVRNTSATARPAARTSAPTAAARPAGSATTDGTVTWVASPNTPMSTPANPRSPTIASAVRWLTDGQP